MALRFPPKRLFQFSIRTMLFAILCVSGYLGAHRIGERAGAARRYDESFFIKIYSVADLVIEHSEPNDREQQCLEIIAYLRSNVALESWGASNAAGQIYEIQPFSANGSLIVSQRGAVHRQLDAALHAYRQRQTRHHTDKATSEVERLAADQLSEPVVLTSYSLAKPLEAAAGELRFDSTVRALTDRWGNPGFKGECTDAGFPLWSVAQSTAIWPKAGGDAYIAVQDWPDVGRALVVGWRSTE